MESLEKYTNARNYGCRIREYTYNGLKTVHMENDLIKVGVLCDKGADIYEFVYKPNDLDFMWHSFNGVKDPRTIVVSKENDDGGFLDCYEGGWQELFPTIGSPSKYKGAVLGIHGEVAMVSWDYDILTDKIDEITILFRVRTTRMPFLLERRMTIKIGEPKLYISEKVINEGLQELDFMWGHHPACGPVFLDDSCEILIDRGDISNIKFDWKGKCVIGNKHEWPILKINDGKDLNVSKIKKPEEQLNMEFAISGFKGAGYEIKNTKKNIGFGLQWDKDMFPHIWMWAIYGGAPEYPWFGRAYVLALEPWSSLPDNINIASENNETIKIGPQQEIKTELVAYAKCYE